MSDYICPYNCSYRTNSGFCGYTGGYDACQYRRLNHKENTVVGYVPPLKRTNADCIRAMTDEELAELFESWIQDCSCNNVPCSEPCKRDREREITDWRDALEHKSCYDCWLDWLRQEAET